MQRPAVTAVAGVQLRQRVLLTARLQAPALDRRDPAQLGEVLASSPAFDPDRPVGFGRFRWLVFDHPLFVGRGDHLLRWCEREVSRAAYARLLARAFPEAAARLFLLENDRSWPAPAAEECAADVARLRRALATSERLPRKDRESLLASWYALAGGDPVAGPAPAQEEQLIVLEEARQTLGQLRQARDRSCLCRVFGLEGQPEQRVSEIARAEGLSKTSVDHILHRALRRCRRICLIREERDRFDLEGQERWPARPRGASSCTASGSPCDCCPAGSAGRTPWPGSPLPSRSPAPCAARGESHRPAPEPGKVQRALSYLTHGPGTDAVRRTLGEPASAPSRADQGSLWDARWSCPGLVQRGRAPEPARSKGDWAAAELWSAIVQAEQLMRSCLWSSPGGVEPDEATRRRRGDELLASVHELFCRAAALLADGAAGRRGSDGDRLGPAEAIGLCRRLLSLRQHLRWLGALPAPDELQRWLLQAIGEATPDPGARCAALLLQLLHFEQEGLKPPGLQAFWPARGAGAAGDDDRQLLAAWRGALQAVGQQHHHGLGAGLVARLAREAALASGGEEALAELALAETSNHPACCVGWAIALLAEGRTGLALELVRRHTDTQFDGPVQASGLDLLARVAEEQQEDEAALRASHGAWRSWPCLPRLFAYLTTAPGQLPAADARLEEELSWLRCQSSPLPLLDRLRLELLAGDRTGALAELRRTARTVGPDRSGAATLLQAFLLVAGSGGPVPPPPPATSLARLWQSAFEDVRARFPRLAPLLVTLDGDPPAEGERRRWLRDGLDRGVELVLAMVDAGPKGVTREVVELVVACAEALVLAGSPDELRSWRDHLTELCSFSPFLRSALSAGLRRSLLLQSR